MLSSIGQKIVLELDGASHSPEIISVVRGIKKGEEIDLEKLQRYVDRRRAKNAVYSTKRIEPDKLIIRKGLLNGITDGCEIIIAVANTNIRSMDYDNILVCPRPGHADYPAYIKFGGKMDMRGGGAFSGRMTLPLVIAGGICSQLLEKKGITVGAYVSRISDISGGSYLDTPIDKNLLNNLKAEDFPVINGKTKEKMLEVIKNAAGAGNSVGGQVECVALGIKAGLGGMVFDGLESKISQMVFGIPAVKAIEFGAGTQLAYMKGTESNDCYYYDNGVVKTYTNNNGGITGGITNGMPIAFRVTIKPTPSISVPQKTIDLVNKVNTEITVKGRHDACIVPRAAVAVESALALVLADILYN